MIRSRSASLVLAFLCLLMPLHATQMIDHPKPERLRHIAGIVVDSRGMTVPYALIEVCNPENQHVIESTFADGNGKFSFADRKRNEKLNLRISLAGFATAQYAISIAAIGKDRIRIVLPAAT